jgi:hypothetical protein
MTSETGTKGVGGEPTVGTATSTVTPRKNPGARLSDEAVLHAGISASVGYDSNVFFNDANKVTSPILEVTPVADLTNGDRGGGRSPEIYYDLRGGLVYREYLTDDPNTKAQRAFNPSAGATLETNRETVVGFALNDSFIRQQEAPYLPSTSTITRDSNLATARLRLAPGGGRLATSLQYSNSVQIFEDKALEYGNSMGHEGVFDVTYKWLPKTALFLEVAQGLITYLNEAQAAANNRHKSYPFKTLVGLRGLISAKVALNAAVGYAAANYQDAKSPSGVGNIAGGADLNYAATALTALGLGYKHEFQNSPIIGDYYDANAAYVTLRQSIVGRLILSMNVRYELRTYHGVVVNGSGVDRQDHLVSAGAVLDYFIQPWLFLGASYGLSLNRVDQSAGAPADYTKHLAYFRLGVGY